MKQKLLLKAMLLLCALVAGSSSVWADNITYTFSSKDWEASDGTNSANWTNYTSGDSFETSGDARGIAKSKATINGTSPDVLSNVSSITVTASANQAGPTLTIYKVVSGTETSIYSASMTKDNNKSYTVNLVGTNVFSGKIKVVLASSSSYKSVWIKSVAVTYSNGSPHELSWSATSKSVTYSETPYDLPTLSNPHSLDVTYDSSDKSVATVASDGTVTIKNVTGSTSITAHTDGNATYAAGTVSYTLNVTRKVVITDGEFDFSLGVDYGSGMSTGSVAVHTATWTAVNITMGVAGRNCWFTDNTTFRLYKKSGDDAAGSITLNCPPGKAITRIDFTGPYTGTGALSNIAANTGTYTVSSSSAIWTGAAQSVTFTNGENSTYINTITVTYGSTVSVSIGATGWATYSAGVALDFANASPDGLSAYMVTGASGSAITKSAAVTNVPANTGLLLNGTASTTYTIPVLSSSATSTTGNLMKACVAATTVKYNDNSSLNYVLANNGGTAEFQKIVEGANGTVKIPAGKAYLALTADPGAPTLSIDFGDANGINTLNVESETLNGEVYNLAGQRVANPTKGLYIVNGRKVVIK